VSRDRPRWPKGFRVVKAPDHLDVRHYKGGSSSAVRIFISTLGHMVLSERTTKKSSLTPPGIDPGTVRLVAQRLNHYATPGYYSYGFETAACPLLIIRMPSFLIMKYLNGRTVYLAQQYCIIINTYNNYNYNIKIQHVSVRAVKPEDSQLNSKKFVLKATHFYCYNYYVYIHI
jgi:hypothetical protein